MDGAAPWRALTEGGVTLDDAVTPDDAAVTPDDDVFDTSFGSTFLSGPGGGIIACSMKRYVFVAVSTSQPFSANGHSDK